MLDTLQSDGLASQDATFFDAYIDRDAFVISAYKGDDRYGYEIFAAIASYAVIALTETESFDMPDSIQVVFRNETDTETLARTTLSTDDVIATLDGDLPLLDFIAEIDIELE